MEWYYYLYDSSGDEYKFSTWSEIDVRKWKRGGKTVPVDEVPVEAEVGDVLLDYPPRTAKEEMEIGDPKIGSQIRAKISEYEQRVEKVAQRHDVDIDTELQTIEDGDIILVSLSHPSVHPDDWGEKFYGFTEGLISDPMLFGIDDGALLNCSLGAIEPGMVFDILNEEEYPYGLRFDEGATAALREEPAEVELLRSLSKITELVEGVDSYDDLEPPFYIAIHEFDDGAYYAGLYDSGTEADPTGHYYENYRFIAEGSARPPYKIRGEWTESDFVPVKELYFSEEEHSDAPIALLSPDAEPIEATRASTYD